MKITVLITTYRRRGLLLRLLQQLKDAAGEHDVMVHIIHDGACPPQYAPVNHWLCTHRPAWSLVSASAHCGKQRYYSLISQLFRIGSRDGADYYIQLPDDIQVAPTFFKDAVTAYESIQDDKKICLNLLRDAREKVGWVSFDPVPRGDVRQTQWVDMCYIAPPSFFKRLGHTVFPISASRFKNPNISSGVGSQISRRIHEQGYHIYQVEKSLVSHGTHESVMHCEHRRHTPLITNNFAHV